MNRKETLESALDAVNRRPKSYGPPEQNFERIAALWNVYLHDKYDIPASIDPVDVAAMMALMKIARLIETPGHDDSWVDLAGYAACGAEVAAAAAERREVRHQYDVEIAPLKADVEATIRAIWKAPGPFDAYYRPGGSQAHPLSTETSDLDQSGAVADGVEQSAACVPAVETSEDK